MAIRINNIEVVDDKKNANLTHMNISYYGEVVALSNTFPTSTPPHAGTVAAYYAGGTNPSIPQIYSWIVRRQKNPTDCGSGRQPENRQ